MRYTYRNTFGYWLFGFSTIWLFMPALLFDIFMAPEWYAPNWQCDSLGIPYYQITSALFPWAIITAFITGVLVFLVVRERQSGADILNLRIGVRPWNWIVSLLALLSIAPFAYDIAMFVWRASVEQTISSDCGGRAEMVVVTMRGPVVQLHPVLEFAFILWALHIRALLLSPRDRTPSQTND